jgi:hypothetical protein
VALVLTVLAVVGGTLGASPAADSAPRIPKLPAGAAGVRGPVRDEPARALPETTTVCWDPAAARCWTVPGESACTAPSALAARPLRVVIGPADGPDAERALAECRAQPDRLEPER